MVSFCSFDPIPISNVGQTFFTPYDAGKSLSEVAEFGPQLPKGAILVELKVHEEVTITCVYPEMVKPDSGNRPTFYEITIDDLDVWNSDSESEDEIGDGWTYTGGMEYRVQSIEEVSSKESQEARTLMKRRHQKAPQLPSPDTYDEKTRSRRKSRNNQMRKTKIKARANAKSTKMEATSRPFPRPVTLEKNFPKSFFDKQCFTSNVINADGGSALNLSFDDRMAPIAALIDPEAYQGKVLEPSKSTTYQDCMPPSRSTMMIYNLDLACIINHYTLVAISENVNYIE
ncbi:hypothetical protein Adt_27686 [Abeliophyllum distichum]|uniref:Uncharacterized protein n=1 Tax=Abeliophyllum distichum TaxID=126358 RepID=A0ABD1RUS6_9LAMI